jgi:release factor glutamine methyltransferase
LRILDLGTGSGCIAVSLAKFLPNAKIDAIDISGKALEIARKNARLNNVEINFIHADLLTSYELGVRSYDIIVCNPPYIPTAEIDRLQPEIRYEPRIALDGGSDGLDFYRKIIRDAPYYLEERGFLVMEMGFDQKNDIENIFQDSGKFDIVKILKDYNAFDRVIVARKS